MSLESTDLCAYQTAGFTQTELAAIEEYDAKLTLPPYFDLREMLDGTDDLERALHRRAEELTRWHAALTALMADPRLDNERRRRGGPRYDEHGEGPYCQAVARYLRIAAEDYHRHRFEYAVTVWALGLQVPDSYPPDSRHADLDNRSLKLWD
ncbi:hypothetical protein ACH4FX_38840 [Streptomyces sp. NPDC018019]|uniref:hypothetical protein n=1 Tax=Streptomyces sp. NPDC018019 TaxID=3365030 RepID=UPI00379D57EA